MRRYIEIYSIILRNSLIRDMSFKANFLLWMVVEVLWFCGQIVFFSIIFGSVDHIGDWTKWEVVLLIGTHQIIAQLFQAFFFVNVANVPGNLAANLYVDHRIQRARGGHHLRDGAAGDGCSLINCSVTVAALPNNKRDK